jgi:hypothetical protein
LYATPQQEGELPKDIRVQFLVDKKTDDKLKGIMAHNGLSLASTMRGLIYSEHRRIRREEAVSK